MSEQTNKPDIDDCHGCLSIIYICGLEPTSVISISHRMCIVRFSCSALLWLNLSRFSFRIATMIAGKRLADIGYRTFSASMMLLTVYGGYLCVMRGYRYMQRQKELKLAAENQHPEVLKD